MKPARLPPRQTQASALLLPPGKVVSQPAKSGHGIAGHQHLTKPITAPGCQALSDCGTAEREKKPRRQKEKRKKREERKKKGKGKREAKRQKEKPRQGAALLRGQGCTQGWRRALGAPTSKDSWARCPLLAAASQVIFIALK